MRILVVTNFYSPHYVGGYELGCFDAVEALKARGHTISVLTSQYRCSQPTAGVKQEEGVYRSLLTDAYQPVDGLVGFLHLLRQQVINPLICQQVCQSFQPDVIYVWNGANIALTRTLSAIANPVPMTCYVFDYWLSNLAKDPWWLLWQRQPQRWLSRSGKGAVRWLLGFTGLLQPPAAPKFQSVTFATHHLMQSLQATGGGWNNSSVIHWGIHLQDYVYRPNHVSPKRLLFVGQVMRHKGVHTVITALSLLKQWGYDDLTLTIAGGVGAQEYGDFLQELVMQLDVAESIQWLGFRPRQELRDIYQQHDILVFPSIWEEPFGITLLEAMASGVAVVSTATGGSREIVSHEVNALIFPRDDATVCASQIQRLLEEPDTAARLSHHARQQVEQNFDFQRTIDAIERSLELAISPNPEPSIRQ